jgi:hypothetical protein
VKGTLIPGADEYLSRLRLGSGSHASIESGACIMEAVSVVSGEPFSDHPKCASRVIGAFLRVWNDDLPDAQRQMLKPYVAKVVGTADGQDVETARARLVQDWYIRVFTSAWLELAELSAHAKTLRSLRRITSTADLIAAQPALDNARSASHAARAAARTASMDAAMDAARHAARNAARNAAWDAALAAAKAAARDAAWTTAMDSARAAALDAGRAAARDAAWDAAMDAAMAAAMATAMAATRDAALAAAMAATRDAAMTAARATARDAAWAAAMAAAWATAMAATRGAAEETLAPTVQRLQESALELLDAMIVARAEVTP